MLQLSSSPQLLWLLPLIQIGYSEGLSPPASLVISPNRTQLFESEPVSVSCEVQDGSTGWTLRGSAGRGLRSRCPLGWRSEAGLRCRHDRLFTWDSGQYWCESKSGQRSNIINITVEGNTSPVLRVLPHSWAVEGDSVTLSCEVTDASSNWTFLWYRAVPYRKDLPYFWHKLERYSAELLPDSSRGAGGSYTLSPTALQHTGLYVCRAEGGEPVHLTHYSPLEGLWVSGLSPPASLVISPNRTQLFESEPVSVSCEVQDGSTGWTLRWLPERQGLFSHHDDWRSGTGPSWSAAQVELRDSGVYWCESEDGQHRHAVSHAVNITVQEIMKPVLRVLPHSWAVEGDSVTLSCEVTDTSSNWTFLWYRAVRYRKDLPYFWHKLERYSAELLPDSSRGAGGSYTLSPAALHHSGLYVCRAEGGEPAYQTGFSNVEDIWVIGLSPPASLVISPNRTQLFESEPVSVSCGVQDGSTGWTLRGSAGRGLRSRCPLGWSSEAGLRCRRDHLFTWDSGQYWCESKSGQHSNIINITVTSGDVILESPAHPVAEGDPLTLRCLSRNSTSTFSADFYKDGSLLQSQTTGEMTIPAVSKAHQGLYKCRHPELGESPESWVTVLRGRPISVLLLVRRVLVVLPYLLVTVTMVMRWHRCPSARIC